MTVMLSHEPRRSWRPMAIVVITMIAVIVTTIAVHNIIIDRVMM